MYLDGGMGGGGWLLTSFFSIIYILGLVCYKHTIHVLRNSRNMYMLAAKYEFAQSMDCAAQTMDPYFVLEIYGLRSHSLHVCLTR